MTDRYVLELQEIDQTQVAFAGGKGAHLGELPRIEGIPRAGRLVRDDGRRAPQAVAPRLAADLLAARRRGPNDEGHPHRMPLSCTCPFAGSGGMWGADQGASTRPVLRSTPRVPAPPTVTRRQFAFLGFLPPVVGSGGAMVSRAPISRSMFSIGLKTQLGVPVTEPPHRMPARKSVPSVWWP